MALGILLTAGLVFARLAAVVSVMPGIGSDGVPMQIRLMIAVVLTAMVVPHAPIYPSEPTLFVLIGAMVTEMMLGILMGGAVSLVFGGLAFATEIIGSQTGRAVALQFYPMLEISQGPMGALAGMMATLVFLGLGQHLTVLVILSESFHAVPPGTPTNILDVAEVFVDMAGPILNSGLQLAGPSILLVFLVNSFVAVLARLAPSMNVFFSIGFLLTVLAGMFLLYLQFPYFLDVHNQMVDDILMGLPEMVDAARRP